jgi:hypothetical protein
MHKMNQRHIITDVGKIKCPHFKYEEYGVKGVGKSRHVIKNMDDYITHDLDHVLHIEACKGLAVTNDYKIAQAYGSIPPEESLRLNGQLSWSDILVNIEEHDPTGVHRKAIKEVADLSPGNELSAIYKYCYFALGAVIPWFFALYLKHSNFSQKTNSSAHWSDSAKLFPNIINYVETLPFKHIGRILFFTTYPNAGVAIHRDSIVTEHKDHNINLFFDGGWRPSFVWDEVNKEKIYLEKGAKSYFFNNRDYHGVDAEPRFRYTLRIDGTFTDELCEKLGLEDGYTWKWDYEK